MISMPRRSYGDLPQESESLKSTIAESEEYISDQLDDARSFSLDSPKSRIPRIQELRKRGSNGVTTSVSWTPKSWHLGLRILRWRSE